nr:hypothetical protein GTC16762_13150 [Pigmentibacter ruber]
MLSSMRKNQIKMKLLIILIAILFHFFLIVGVLFFNSFHLPNFKSYKQLLNPPLKVTIIEKKEFRTLNNSVKLRKNTVAF